MIRQMPPAHGSRAPSALAAGALCLALLLPGCRGKETRPSPPDDRPRLVSLSPALTEALFAVGCGGLLVGRDSWSDHPMAARSVPALPGLVPSAEAIVALRPTLVLSSFPPARLTRGLDAAGVRWRGLSPRRLPEIGATLAAVGTLCGRPADGHRAAADFAEAIARVRSARPTGPPIRAYLELDPGQGRPHTIGGETFLDDALGAAGARNVFAGSGAWVQVNAEQILAARPELVVVTHRDPGVARRALAGRAGWANLAPEIVVVHPDLVSRPGPRLTQGLQRIAAGVRAAAERRAARRAHRSR